MARLKIGDKPTNVAKDGFNDFARYTFSQVEGLNGTLSLLKNGLRLINTPKQS